MSLINDMLKNLERNAQPVALPRHFIDMQFNISSEWRKNRKYYLAITVLLIILGCCASFIVWKDHFKTTNAVQKIGKTSVAPVQDVALTLPSMTLLTGIALQIQDGMTNLRFLLNHDTLYKVSHDTTNNALVIILEHAQLLAAVPNLNYAGSGIQQIQVLSDENNNLKLVIPLSAGAEVRRLELNEQGKSPELQVDIFYREDMNAPQAVDHPVDHANVAPTTMKTPISESIAEKEYQRAQSFSVNGRVYDAIQILQTVLMSYPENEQARILLATLLLQQKNNTAAKSVIDAGLELHPDNLIFVKLKAHLLVDEDKITEAISLLEDAAPPLMDNPDYHAFVAALYQREGKSALAASLYKQLLSLQPSNAKWWVGLGVALDAMGSHSQALEAYTNATNTNGLNPELKAYAESQLAAK